MTKPLVEYCLGAVRALNAQYEMTNVLGHSVTAGSARERLIRDFLTAHIPEMTNVVAGVIVDFNDKRSKQQDIILVLKSMPRLAFSSGDDLVLQEGVVATFEIKTDIKPNILKKIAQNIGSVRALKPTTLGGSQMGDLSWPFARILSVILTYGGSELNVIEHALKHMEPQELPDIYLDLTKGILIRNEGFLFDQDGTESYLRFDSPEVGLARLLASLSKVTGCLTMRTVKWEAYIS